jgi:hypothetical protein
LDSAIKHTKTETVTKEQVEKALYNNCQKEDILNELFPPKFKAGDYLTPIDDDTLMCATRGCVCLVNSLSKDYVNVEWISETDQHDGNYYLSRFRHATPEEIEAATWKEGELYKVLHQYVRISAKTVGEFYNNGAYKGGTSKFDIYEKLNTCRCGFCVKEKEG